MLPFVQSVVEGQANHTPRGNRVTAVTIDWM